jgi:hypothetical protein
MVHNRFNALAAALLAVGVAAAVHAAPANVAEWATAFAAPTIAGAGIDATGKTLTFGHLELVGASGRLYPVMVGERVAGAYLYGTGTFRYTSTDPLEASAYRLNASRVSSYDVSNEGVISDKVSGALIMVSAGAEELAAGQPWRTGSPGAEAQAAFADHLKRFENDLTTRYTQIMPEAVIDPPAQPVVAIELVAGKDDLIYLLDPLRDGDENIAVMRRPKTELKFYHEHRYPDQLSVQPIGRARLDPRPRRSLLMAVDAALTNPGGLRADLEVRETFQAFAPVRVLDLDLWSSHVGTEGPTANPVEHSYDLHGVTTAAGEHLSFAHTDSDLLVELPHALAAGETIELVFTISGDVLFHPGNDSYWELGTSAWLPMPNRIDLMAASYHAVVKVKKPFIPFSCGETVRRWEEGEMACAEFREEKPIQIPVILAGEYTTTSEEHDGVTVRVSAYAMNKPKGVKKLIDLSFSLLAFYRNFLNDYPFKELNIIEINEYGFGQAPAGVIFITKEAFNPMSEEATRLFSEGINARVAHELAHAWWGHVAKLALPEDQWLSESTAQYYSAFAVGKLGGARRFDEGLKEWKTRAANLSDHGTVYTANYLSGRRGREDREALLYGKGPLVLHALRAELGDQTFFLILKSYLKSFYFKPAETRHFIGLTNFVTKKDYTDWFNRYLLGTDWPKS